MKLRLLHMYESPGSSCPEGGQAAIALILCQRICLGGFKHIVKQLRDKSIRVTYECLRSLHVP